MVGISRVGVRDGAVVQARVGISVWIRVEIRISVRG